MKIIQVATAVIFGRGPKETSTMKIWDPRSPRRQCDMVGADAPVERRYNMRVLARRVAAAPTYAAQRRLIAAEVARTWRRLAPPGSLDRLQRSMPRVAFVRCRRIAQDSERITVEHDDYGALR